MNIRQPIERLRLMVQNARMDEMLRRELAAILRDLETLDNVTPVNERLHA